MARYGNSIGRVPASVGTSDGPAHLFEIPINTPQLKVVIRVRAEFKDGKAWLIRYSGRFQDRERQDLMEKNKGEDEWSDPVAFQGRNFWMTKLKKDLRATGFRIGDLTVVEIVTSDCVKGMAQQRAAEVAQVRSLPPEWEPALPGSAEKAPVPAGTPPGTPAPANPNSRLPGL